MKKIIKILIISATITGYNCDGITTIGKLNTETMINNQTERSHVYYLIDEQPYATGGLIFTHPDGLFKTAPHVQVSVQPNSMHSDSETYVIEVSENNAAYTKIMAYAISTTQTTSAKNDPKLTINHKAHTSLTISSLPRRLLDQLKLYYTLAIASLSSRYSTMAYENSHKHSNAIAVKEAKNNSITISFLAIGK